MIGSGVYSVPEAARLVHVKPQTASRWFRGRTDSASGPVIDPDYPSVENHHAVSFLDLIDLLVVGRFRDEGVSLQTVRRVYHTLSTRLGTKHAFSHQRLLTDGSTIFIETLDEVGAEDLEEVLTRQKAFPEVLSRYLREVDYDQSTHIAERWRIAQGVIVDPARAFGKPIVEDSSVTTFVLSKTYLANGSDAELVADLFGVTPQIVLNAVYFERKIAA